MTSGTSGTFRATGMFGMSLFRCHLLLSWHYPGSKPTVAAHKGWGFS